MVEVAIDQELLDVSNNIQSLFSFDVRRQTFIPRKVHDLVYNGTKVAGIACDLQLSERRHD
jgi:hypothetical protein